MKKWLKDWLPLLIGFSVVIGALMFTIISAINTRHYYEKVYAEVQILLSEEKYEESIKKLKDLNGYLDSNDILKDVKRKVVFEKINSLEDKSADNIFQIFEEYYRMY